MLTYRGDKFVRGKKFNINEEIYYFSKRENDKLIFESVKDNSKLTLTEEEFNKTEEILTEKINQENIEVNKKIYDILKKIHRGSTLSDKENQLLKKYNIKQSGHELVGSNGNILNISVFKRGRISGPSAPGQNGTHASDKATRRAGHYKGPWNSMPNTSKSTEIDFLNYLTKPDTGYDFRGDKKYADYKGDSKQPIDTSTNPALADFLFKRSVAYDAKSRLDRIKKPIKQTYIDKFNKDMTEYKDAVSEYKSDIKNYDKYTKEIKSKVHPYKPSWDKDDTINEACVTDYIDKKELDSLLKSNDNFGKVGSYTLSDDMSIKTQDGKTYKVTIADNAIEARPVGENGEYIGDPFLLKKLSESTNKSSLKDKRTK